MDSNHEQANRHDMANSKGGSRKAKNTSKLILLITFSVLIIFGLTLKATTYIENPGLCKRCHSMKFYYNTWADSTHSSVSCYACHIGYTPVKTVEKIPLTEKKYWALSFGDKTINISQYMNQVKELVGSINRRIEQLSRQVNFVSARLQDLKRFFSIVPVGEGNESIGSMWKNCLSCHKDLGAKSTSDNLAHDRHLQVGLTCDKCHRQVVHGKVVSMTRVECKECHKQPLPKPSSHKNSKFQFNHGESFKKRQACLICHVQGAREKLCMDCHGIIMPHRDGFPEIHVQSIKEAGIRKCLNCHQNSDNKGTVKRDSASDCSRCHGADMPHKGNMKTVQSHGALVLKKGTQSCNACHNPPFCNDCHGGVPMPHPKNFLPKHMPLAKNLGVDKCENCHKLGSGKAKECISCHQVEMPHPEEWKLNHATEDKVTCNKCHSPKNQVNPNAPWAKQSYCDSCHKIGNTDHHGTVPAESCVNCHVQDFCAKCHGSGQMSW